MVRLLFVLGLFLIVLKPIWYLLRTFKRKFDAEIEVNSTEEDLKEIKQRKRVFKDRVREQEREIQKKQKQNQKIKKEIEDGRL